MRPNSVICSSPLKCIAFAIVALFASTSGIAQEGSTHRQPQKIEIHLSKPLTAVWSFSAEQTTGITPAIGDGVVYIPLSNGALTAVDLAKGEMIWRSELGGTIAAPPVLGDSAVYVSIRNFNKTSSPPTHAPEGSLQAVSLRTGLPLWLRKFDSDVSGSAIIYGDEYLITATSDGSIYRLNKSTGNNDWKIKNQGNIRSQPGLSGRSLYFGDERGFFNSLNVETGSVNWRYQTRKPVRIPPSFSGDLVFAASSDGFVYALHKESGELLWRVRTGASVQSLVQTNKCVIATSFDNFAYCLSQETGKKVWKYKFAGRILAQPLVTHDAVMFGSISADEYVVLEITKGRKVNGIMIGEDKITSAAPVVYENLILVTTRQGIIAYKQYAPTSSK